jgi:chromate transporter
VTAIANDDASAPRVRPTIADLFVGFCAVAVSGFGGVLPFARRMVVERRRWLTGPEFTDLLALGQFLPGPNVVNVAVCVGQRFHGWRGAVAAVFGIMAAPVGIVLCLGLLFARYGDIAEVRRVTIGVGAAAAGLVIATAIKMAWPLRGRAWAMVALVAAAAAIGILRWPLFHVLAVLVPIAIGCAWWDLRHDASGGKQ